MSDLFTRYAPITGSVTDTYFAGANTADGFVGAYGDFLRETQLDSFVILKGGSGTGKSSLIRACASEGTRLGADVTMLLCSSDPGSADAVLIRGANGRAIAIADGTAPHTLDPELPGAVGEIVDLGRYWQADRLRPCREQIYSLRIRKQEAYARAYRFLSAYRHLGNARQALVIPCLRKEKMEAVAARIVSAFPEEKEAVVETRYTYALSMTGAYRLTTLCDYARREYRILDTGGAGEYMLRAVWRAAAQRRCRMILAPAPACRDTPAELYFPASHTAFTLALTREEAKEGVQYINMQRFLDRAALSQCRGRLRFLDRCRRMLMDGALDALHEAGECHFSLEEIYKSAMNFQAVDEERNCLLARIADLLQG